MKEIPVTYVSGRKGTTKVFTTRQEADDILDGLRRPKLIQLRDRARKLGLDLSSSGGYYRLSGLVHGTHMQGVFTNLRSVERQLTNINKSNKFVKSILNECD